MEDRDWNKVVVDREKIKLLCTKITEDIDHYDYCQLIHDVIFEDLAENYVSDSYESEMPEELIDKGMELIEDLENRLVGGIQAIFGAWYRDNFKEGL